MADTGWVLAGTGTNVPVAGGVNWANPNNITSATDSSWSLATDTSGSSPPTAILQATNFGMAVPSGAAITGVEARIRAGGQGTGAVRPYSDLAVNLTRNGSTVGNNKAQHTWPVTSAYETQDYGGVADLWGVVIDADFVNSSSFGLRFRMQSSLTKPAIRVVAIWMRIHFEESGGGVFVRDGGIWKEGDAYVRDGGIWKPSQQYIRDSGVWKS